MGPNYWTHKVACCCYGNGCILGCLDTPFTEFRCGVRFVLTVLTVLPLIMKICKWIWTVQEISSKCVLTVSALLAPQSTPKDSNDDENDVTTVLNGYQSHYLVGTDDRPDDINFRYLLWRAMHSFPEVCEPRSQIVTPLFFDFLE